MSADLQLMTYYVMYRFIELQLSTQEFEGYDDDEGSQDSDSSEAVSVLLNRRDSMYSFCFLCLVLG